MPVKPRSMPARASSLLILPQKSWLRAEPTGLSYFCLRHNRNMRALSATQHSRVSVARALPNHAESHTCVCCQLRKYMDITEKPLKAPEAQF